MSWGIVASAVSGGAVAAAVGALIGVGVSRYRRDRWWLRDRQADSCAAVLAQHARIEVELRTAHRHQRPPAVDWALWQGAVASLTLTASQAVADAVADLTEAILMVEDQVGYGHDAPWPPQRDILIAAQMSFTNAARQALDRSQHPLRLYAGTHRYPRRDPLAHRGDRSATLAGRRPAPTTGGRPAASVNGSVSVPAGR
jgi:hypothetical protein